MADIEADDAEFDDPEFDRAWAATLEADAELLGRLTRELLTTGKVSFSRNGATLTAEIRNGRTLTAEVTPEGGWLRIYLNSNQNTPPYILCNLGRPGLYDEYRASEVRGQLGLGLMNL